MTEDEEDHDVFDDKNRVPAVPMTPMTPLSPHTPPATSQWQQTGKNRQKSTYSITFMGQNQLIMITDIKCHYQIYGNIYHQESNHVLIKARNITVLKSVCKF